MPGYHGPEHQNIQRGPASQDNAHTAPQGAQNGLPQDYGAWTQGEPQTPAEAPQGGGNGQ